MFPAAGLIVDELPLQPDDVGEQPFGQTVLAHDVGGDPAALCGEFEVAVIADVEQTVAFHPGHGLRHGGPGVLQAFGDASAPRHARVFFAFHDRFVAPLGCITEAVHCCPASPLSASWPRRAIGASISSSSRAPATATRPFRGLAAIANSVNLILNRS